MTAPAGVEPAPKLFLLVLTIAVCWMAWPLWATRYLPIEDLPQHVAAIRVLHSFADPHFGFQRYFELQIFRTQYLAYYGVVDALAYLLDLELANRLVVVLCVVATPLALLYLLEGLGRERVLALFALPLIYNAHLILGFINFLMGIAAALFGLGLCARQCRHATSARALALALVSLFCFFCHVVPFAFLVLGSLLLAARRDVRQLARLCAPLAPATLIGLLWLAQSPAGRATLSTVRLADAEANGGVHPTFQPAAVALRELPSWLTDVLVEPNGIRALVGFGALLGLTLALGLGRVLYLLVSQRARTKAATSEPGARHFLRLAPLAPLAAALYFVLPTGYAWIWPIAQRFPLLALLLLLPALPRLPRRSWLVVALGLAVLCAHERIRVAHAFAHFDGEEVGDFDAALATIPEAQRVAGLIYARGSQSVRFSPFIHYVAYYQARKGGAVMFTFADFPQSPFRFREQNRPPRVPPRWEWLPQRVRPSELAWYDYVLVRGGMADPCAGTCELRFRRGFWSVWGRRP